MALLAPILCTIASVQCVQEADKRKQEACRLVSCSWALASFPRVTDALFIYLVGISYGGVHSDADTLYHPALAGLNFS